ADRIKHWIKELNNNVERGQFLTVAELDPLVEPEEDTDAVLDARIQKALFTLVKERLDANPEQNQRFKETADIKLLQQLLTLARVKELTRVRIVKKGRSAGGAGFDVDELSRTFYGRRVLDGLGFTKRRKILDRDEFDKVKDEFQKIKLALPEAVEPTTTEKYFALDVAP
ncbi:MAG TPA: hypothetical protein VFE62_16390, partial [Gemmataceae bacterium]|nr:hypothetical protein [Gemmataceae bacterium]